jgi:hypothetical protein
VKERLYLQQAGVAVIDRKIILKYIFKKRVVKDCIYLVQLGAIGEVTQFFPKVLDRKLF